MQSIEVVAGIIWNKGRFLAARRYGCKHGSGFWEFPGGKIEPGESAAEALQRELEEELGLLAQEFCYWKSQTHQYAAYQVILHFFHVTGYQHYPALIEGHDALAWIRPEDCCQYPFLPADARILEEVQHDYPLPGQNNQAESHAR